MIDAMRSIDFYRHLEKSSVAPVYLFKGDADLLMEEAWNKLVEKVIPAKARRFNGEKLQAKECSAAEVVTRLSSIAMFGTKRLLMVQGAEAWPKDQQKEVLSYIAEPYPTACLVLTVFGKKGLEKLEAAVSSVGVVVDLAGPTEWNAPRWLQDRALSQNKKLSPKAASFLLEQTGLDLHLLEKELEKLVSYVGDRKTIELEDVQDVVSSQRGFTIFELLRLISRRESSQALRALARLIRAGEPPLAILALMARQVRILWQSKDAVNRGVSLAELGRHLRLPQSVVKNYVKESSFFSERELYHLHKAIRAVDVGLKGTGTKPEWLMEDLVLKLTEGVGRTC